MSIFNEFAKLIGVEPRLAEDALHSERAAKHTLSRRKLFGVAAAMATGLVIGEMPAARVIYIDRLMLPMGMHHLNIYLWLYHKAMAERRDGGQSPFVLAAEIA